MKMEHLQKLHIVKSYGPTQTTLLHYLIAIIKSQVEDESLISNFELEVQENVSPIQGEEFGMLQTTIKSLRNGLAYFWLRVKYVIHLQQWETPLEPRIRIILKRLMK